MQGAHSLLRATTLHLIFFVCGYLIAISVGGLPDKVTAEPMISAKTGDSAKSVKLVLKSEPGIVFSGPIQIFGRSQSEPEVTRQALLPLPAFGTLSGHLWLTVVPAPLNSK